jgi:hypothetical protein
VPVSFEHPIGDDQEESVYEEEDTQFVGRQVDFPSLHILFGTYIIAYLHNDYFTCCYALN